MKFVGSLGGQVSQCPIAVDANACSFILTRRIIPAAMKTVTIL